MASDKRVHLAINPDFGTAFAMVLDTAIVLGTVLVVALAGACASSSDARDRRAEAETDPWAELEAHADDLFGALERVADARQLPISRRDASRRRLTTDWIEEDPSTHRRYFLSVVVHPAGLAVRAHIVREELQEDGGDVADWRELPPTDEVTAEEGAIIEEAHRIWLDGDR